MENKQEILDKLLETLKLTRDQANLYTLSYLEEHDEEYVVAEYHNNFKKKICVTWDSGLSMIRDVLEGIR